MVFVFLILSLDFFGFLRFSLVFIGFPTVFVCFPWFSFVFALHSLWRPIPGPGDVKIEFSVQKHARGWSQILFSSTRDLVGGRHVDQPVGRRHDEEA